MRLGVIGDIHGCWDERDTAFFNAAGYDALLLVGDLARVVNGVPVARRIAELTVPAWAIPGNHDGVTLTQLLAEIKHRRVIQRLGSYGMERRVADIAAAYGPVRLGGYTRAALADDLGLIVARPHAMGGDRLYFQDYLRRRFGVTDLESSAALLCALVDAAPRDLVFLAHNGPMGLGDTPTAPYGCDFDPAKGDFGDADLRTAIDHARASGHRVRAVVSGHMHHRHKHSDTERKTWADDGATRYINAARVPRIEAGGARRHHVALTLEPGAVRAASVVVDAAGEIVERTPLGV